MAVYYCFAFLDAAIPRYAPPLNRSSVNSSVTLLLSPVWGIVNTALPSETFPHFRSILSTFNYTPLSKICQETHGNQTSAQKSYKKAHRLTADALADYAIKSVFLFFFLLGGLVCLVGNAQFTHGDNQNRNDQEDGAIVRAEAAAPAASLFSFLPSLAGETMLMVA